MASDIANDVAGILIGTADEISGKKVSFPVIGTMDGELNLLLDGFGRGIPKADYHVLEPRVNLYTTPGPLYTTFSKDYRVELILKPADRVVCIPIEDGHTFLIIGHVKGGMAP